jgi:adenylate cyclase
VWLRTHSSRRQCNRSGLPWPGIPRSETPLPRARPTFATWLNLSTLGSLFWFAALGVTLGVVLDRAGEVPSPVLAVLIAATLTLSLGLPITVGTVVAPSLRPIRDLADATVRVAKGDYGQRLPVVQDDDLDALSASFNRMQAGLAERQRLQAAFGSYVDPTLAACYSSRVTMFSPVSAGR